MQLDLDNVEGPAGDYRVTVAGRRPGRGRQAAPQTLRLARQAARPSSPCRSPPSAAGIADDQGAASPGPADFALERNYTLAAKPATQILTRRTVRPIAKGESLTLSNDLFADLVPGTGAVSRLGRPVDRARRRDAAQGARPLSVRLLRADHQPRAAAALRQRARRPRRISRSTPRSTSASATPSSGCWRARARTARSACGRSAATTPGSTPTSPTS